MLNHGLHVKAEVLSRTEAAWTELFQVSPGVTPFLSFEWFQTLSRHLLKDDPQVLVFSQGNAVIGIIPARIDEGRLILIGDDRVTDLNGMLWASGHEHEVIECLSRYVSQHALSIDLHPLETDSPLVTMLGRHVQGLRVERIDTCPLLELTSNWNEYLDGLTGKARHELRRKMNKVNGATLSDVQPSDIEKLFDLMVRSDEAKRSFLKTETMGFFRDLAEEFSAKEWLRLRVAYLGESILGMIFAFGFRDRVFLFNMGFAPELRQLSPGIVTVALDIKAAIEEGYHFYDFLRGTEKYKYGLGARERQTVRITA